MICRQLFGITGFAHCRFRDLHRQLTAVGVTGFLDPLLAKGFCCHPLARELSEDGGLVSIQNEGLITAVHLADHVALEIVQIGDLGLIVPITCAKAK